MHACFVCIEERPLFQSFLASLYFILEDLPLMLLYYIYIYIYILFIIYLIIITVAKSGGESMPLHIPRYGSNSVTFQYKTLAETCDREKHLNFLKCIYIYIYISVSICILISYIYICICNN